MTIPYRVYDDQSHAPESQSSYVLRTGAEGAQRLRLIARAKWPTTRILLGRAGLRRGMRCLDVGCGAGDVTLEMARVVGDEGEVIGIDADPLVLESARAEAERRAVKASFRVGDATQIGESPVYDLVFARFVLTHLTHPEVALQSMMAATRPGGVIVVEDIDFAGHVCYPPSHAFDRYLALYQDVVCLRGGDPTVGRRLFGLLRAAGAEDVQVDVTQPVYASGDGKLVAVVTMEHIREAVVGATLTSNAEVDAIVAELETYAHDPEAVMSLPRIFQVWGQRPANQ